MSIDQWIAVAVVAIPALGAVVLGWINRQKLNAIHVEINSRLSQLLDANSRAEHSAGLAIGGASADQIRQMIDQAITRAMLTPTPDTMAAMAAATAAATAAALVTSEARAVASDLKTTAADAAANLVARPPHP